MLKGRLGLETAGIPHRDRHGLLWLRRGELSVRDGTLEFQSAGSDRLPPGSFDLPVQRISGIILEPGSTVTHDALRLLARYATGLVVSGDNGVRYYAGMPFGARDSELARRQVEIWSNEDTRIEAARRMYAWRLGEVVPHADLDNLRGREGARMKETYRLLAQQHGVRWRGRRYDREDPSANDLPNQAINHAATATEAAALIAVASTQTIPQLGFIHEHARHAFALDIADLFRTEITLPVAFAAASRAESMADAAIEPLVRKKIGRVFRQETLIAQMIDRIKDLFEDAA